MRGSLLVVGVLSLSVRGARADAPPPASSALPAVHASSSSVVESSSAPATSSSTARSWRSLPNTAFGAPEYLTFVIKWGVISAGRSSLDIAGIEDVNGRPAYHLSSVARSNGFVDTFYHVDDHNDAWLDCRSLVSVRYAKSLHEGSYRVEETVSMDPIGGRWSRLTRRLDKKTTEEKSGDLPPDTLDVQGSLYVVRTLPLEVGKSFSIDVHSGDKIYPLLVTVRKREKVKVPAGEFDCFLVEPLLRGPGMFVSKGKKLDVWMTADERRMPVRMRSEVFFGHVSAELLEYKVTPPTPIL